MGRSIGLDVHRDFCEVAIADGGRARSAGRIATTSRQLELFAPSLAADDRVVLEATGNAFAIARILEPHVAEVVFAHAKLVRAISHARVKTDKIDAARVRRSAGRDLIPAVWIGDERVRMLRRLVVAPPRAGQAPHADQERDLGGVASQPQGPPPAERSVRRKGRAWLAEQQLPIDERLTVDAGLRQLDFLAGELAQIDRVDRRSRCRRRGRAAADDDPRHRRDHRRDAGRGDRRRRAVPVARVTWSAISACIPRSASRAPSPARHGRLSKEGSAAARHVLVEAAWTAAQAPGPLRAFAQRTAARRGRHVAAVAVARKLAVLAWHLLTRGEDYAFARPGTVRRKLRRLELAAGAPRAKTGPKPDPVWNTDSDEREKRLALQAEIAYRRLVADWQATGPKVGAGATPERASSRPSKGKAARQAHCS